MKKSIYVILFAILVSGIANASLVAHYEFEGNADDSAGSNHGTLMGDATYGTGPVYGGKNFGQALSLDGDGDYVDCGSSFASVTGSTTKTIMAWVKSNTTDYPSIDASRGGRIVTLYRGNGSSGFTTYAAYESATWRSLYRKNGNISQEIDSTISISVGAWTHVALVQDGANIFLYINGQLESTADNAAAPTISNPLNADIGAYDGAGYGMSSFFNGLIDDVRIYDHALSESEIQAVMPEPATLLLLGLGGLILRRKN